MEMDETAKRLFRAIKQPHELPRRILKYLFLFNIKRIERVVESAYKKPEGIDHQRIKKAAAIAYGVYKRKSLTRAHAKAFLWAVGTAKLNLFKKDINLNLGAAPIGFGQLKVGCSTTSGYSAHVYLQGCDDVVLFRMFERLVSPGASAIDVGANIGIHTCVLSKCVGEQGVVYAYEPVKANVRDLKSNLQINQITNVVVRDVGVGSQAGSVPFHFTEDNDFNKGMSRYDPDAKRTIPVVALDDDLQSIENIALIKIDVEGMELDVIKGSRDLLGKHRPYLVVELNQNDWSLSDLAELLPYKHRVFMKPFDLTGKWQPVEDCDTSLLPDPWDILVVPDDKMDMLN
jgi:FkbM family methyltransferase